MTVEQIKEMSIKELKETLVLNTVEVKYDAEDLPVALDDIFTQFFLEKNVLLEKKVLWKTIFIKFFQISDIIVDAIMERLNWFDFILWCEDTLLVKKEIAFFVNMYYQYRSDSTSISAILTDLIESVMTGLTEIQPDQIQVLFDQLENKVKNLPDLIKEQL